MSVLTEEILSIIPRFFDGGAGPSHDDLTRLFVRFGLNKADPAEPGTPVGKVKRLRAVLAYAIEEGPGAGGNLVRAIVDQLRAHGAFRESSETFAGPDLIASLRDAFRHEGFDLDAAGNLRPTLFENFAIHQKESEGADVKWNDSINGRQLDVAIRFQFGLHTYLTVIECRHSDKAIEATDVDAFATKSRDANANKAIMVTSSRYQTGCFRVAERHAIDLYTLKQIDDLPEDLFLPETIAGAAIWRIALVTSTSGGEIRLPDEEPSRLQFIIQHARLSYEGQTRSLADVIERIISSSSRELSREERKYRAGFSTLRPLSRCRISTTPLSRNASSFVH